MQSVHLKNATKGKYAAVLTKLKERIASADKPPDIWLIHDFLTEELRKIEYKYDYRYSVLILRVSKAP